jgi:hypothetical protein
VTVTLSPLERRVGRQLTAAEQHIDVLAIDELLNGAKDQLEQAILDEQRRYARAKARGRAARMEVTDAMRRVISNLREAGRTHGAQELRSMGYPVAPPTRRYAAGDDLEATLRARLATLTVKIEHQALGADISTVAATAVERAAMRILGGRGIAADLVSPAFIGGLAQTFEQHADIVERWQYTAVNDAGLCSLCAPHDGAIYDTLEALFAVLTGDDDYERKLAQLRLFVDDLRPFWPLLVPVFIGWMGAQFATEGGWGGQTWAPLSPAYAQWKAAHYPGRSILIREGAMRRAASAAAPRGVTQEARAVDRRPESAAPPGGRPGRLCLRGR